MKVLMFIPYANGDPVYDFSYWGGEITPKEYVKMENDEYYGHKKQVDKMVITSLGNNMSVNTYEKRKVNVKKQSYQFHTCMGNMRSGNGSELTMAELDRHWVNKEQFALIVYLNQSEIEKKPDLEIDLKMWIQDSQKIFNIDKLSAEEKIFHLPKKDFKIDFDDGQSHAVLKNCKFAKLMSTTKDKIGRIPVGSFAMIVERVVFVKQ